MLILNINGPINSGKSTVSKILVQQLKSACFIEVDDLLSDRERHLLGLNREEGWRERIRRLQEIVRTEKRKKQYENIIFAYPMTGKLFNEWKNWEDKNTKFINITLAPPMESASESAEKGVCPGRKLRELRKCTVRDIITQNMRI